MYFHMYYIFISYQNGVSAFDIMRVLSRDHEAVSEAFEELGIKEEKGNKISEVRKMNLCLLCNYYYFRTLMTLCTD